LAILTELLLRGPQTPGELRTRASRMAPFNDASEVEAALERLTAQDEGPGARQPLAACLAREPGRREARYAHLLSGPVAAAASPKVDAEQLAAGEPQEERIARLEEEVRALRGELSALKASLGL
jgi:uncharacterized protein YceH (UPF0502 family)